MKRSTAAAMGSLLAGAAYASAGSGVVQWDIQRREVPGGQLRKRASTYTATIANEQTRGGYFATCEVGTPAQKLTLQLDTGSSDIWVPSSAASICSTSSTSSSSSSGCDLGSFTASSSSTFKEVGKGKFTIQYVDGSGSSGDYFTDVFSIGGASLTNMTMGLGNDTTIAYGLVGIGYKGDEASNLRNSIGSYDNLPVNMVDQGLINTYAYSLWLNDLDASSGSILFGGIDTDKYHGELTRVKVYPTSGSTYTSFMVAFTSMTAHSSSGNDTLSSSEFPIAAILDSGTTLSYLPTDLAEEVWKEAGAVYSSADQVALIPCKLRTSSGTFSFGFGGSNGASITVDMSELVLDLTTGTAPKFTTGKYAGQDACEFGIQNFSSSPYLLGDTFLRSAYVVYDLANNQIGLAQTDFNATTSNVVAFASMSAAIPSSTDAPNQAEVSSSGSTSSPGYGASAGFSSGTSSAGVRAVPVGNAHLAVATLSMLFVLLGSGIFFLL